MSLRAVARLQEADLIVHDPGLPLVLELARRDALRIEPEDDGTEKAISDTIGAGENLVFLVRAIAPGLLDRLTRLAGEPPEVLPGWSDPDGRTDGDNQPG